MSAGLSRRGVKGGRKCIPHAHPDHREVQQHSVVLSAQQHIGAWTKTIAAAVRLGPARTPEPRPLPAGWGGTPGRPAGGTSAGS